MKTVLSPQEKIDLQIKLEEFFFDPAKKTNKYRTVWIRNHENRVVSIRNISFDPAYRKVRFSPLYNIRRDAFFCLGINPETGKKFNTRTDFGPANLAAVILLGSTCEMLAAIKYKVIGSATPRQRDSFIEKYFGIPPDLAKAIRILRNSVVHVNYGLMVPVGHHNPFGVKVFFYLGRGIPLPAPIQPVKVQRKYQALNFAIDPEKVLEKIDASCLALRDEIWESQSHARWFLKNIRQKHWINY